MNIGFIDKTFASLRHENFRVFFTGQTVSLIGSWMQITALSWLVYDMTDSKLLLGLIGALSSLPMLFLSILGGVFADKYARKKILMLTQGCSMVIALCLAILVGFNLIKIWHIVLFATLSGIVFAIDLPVRQSFYIDIVGKKDLMNAIALNSSMVNTARIIGPALAGIIMVKYGIVWCFILNSISYSAVLAALFRIKVINIQTHQHIESFVKYAVDGFKYVRRNKAIFDLLLLMIIIGIFGFSYGILFPAVAKDILHTGEKGYAALVSANGAGALIGALLVAYLGNSPYKRTLVHWGVYLFGISVILIAFCKSYWLILLLIGFAGIGSIAYYNLTTTLIQEYVDDSVRGRVMGIWSLIFGGTGPIGNLFVGISAEYFGISPTLLISASACIFASLIMSVLSRSNEADHDIEKDSIKI